MIREAFKHLDDLEGVYLDNASTTQKPIQVVKAMEDFYTSYCSNIHRSNSKVANKATTEYEACRQHISTFLNAQKPEEIIFTKGITDSFNFIASSFVKNRFKTVIISSLEHHSNITPWHLQGRRLGDGLEVVQTKEHLLFDMAHFEALLKKNAPCFVSVVHTSNAFGIIHPVDEIIQKAHEYDCIVMIDGAQSTPHFKVDMQELKADFYAISGHKMFAPMGVGALYINSQHFDNLTPYQGGGGSIDKVTFDASTFTQPPLCFEAGTPNIPAVIGFNKALEVLEDDRL